MVIATPFKQVRVVSDGKIQPTESSINFKPSMLTKSKQIDKSHNAANLTVTAFTNTIVVKAFFGILILLKLKKEQLLSTRKMTSKKNNPKNSIKKFLTRNLYKFKNNSNITY